MLLVLRQSLLHLSTLTTILDTLFGASTNEILGVQHSVNLSPDWFEEFSTLDAFNQIILAAQILDDVACLVA